MRQKPALTAADVQKMAAPARPRPRRTSGSSPSRSWTMPASRSAGASGRRRAFHLQDARARPQSAVSRRPTKFWEDRIKERPALLKPPAARRSRAACRSWCRANAWAPSASRASSRMRTSKWRTPAWPRSAREVAMTKPRIRHIALNVQDRDQVAEYYKKIFGVEEKYRGPQRHDLPVRWLRGHRPDPPDGYPVGHQSLRLRGGKRPGHRGRRRHDRGVEHLRSRGGELDTRPGGQPGRYRRTRMADLTSSRLGVAMKDE